MLKKIIVLLFIVAGFISCSDDPSSIGKNLIPPGDKVYLDTLDTSADNISQTSSFFSKEIELGVSSRILLGKLSSGLESSILIKFPITLPDSMKSLLTADSTGLVINKAWVDLYPTYRIGDENSSFDFTVFNVRNAWTPSGFNRDSLSIIEAQTDLNSNVKLDAATVTDSIITYFLKPEIVSGWLKSSVLGGYLQNNGMLLKSLSTNQQIIGFQALSQTLVSVRPKLNIELSKPGVYTDTLIYNPNADVHIISPSNQGFSSDMINLQGGVAYRGKLAFDFSDMDKSTIVNSAIMTLTLDSLSSNQGDPRPDYLYASIYADSSAAVDSVLNTAGSVTFTRNGSVFEGEIAPFVQRWIDGVSNVGMRLSLYGEESTASHLAFYGSSFSDSSKRPKIVIKVTRRYAP
ncbi:MAG: hypothetical protein K9I69_07725 [Ignavibacteriales bacterium]|nr:hypothetical protein [Ignavibacteriales bacterium]MCF8435433.1 hypothetical protein [Ignavibacteriales bacterium]